MDDLIRELFTLSQDVLEDYADQGILSEELFTKLVELFPTNTRLRDSLEHFYG